MSAINAWMVRAGEGGRFFDAFRDKGLVALGWPEMADPLRFPDRQRLVEAIRATYPDYSQQGAAMAAGQLWHFVHDVKVGDRVATYDPRARSYLCGVVTGDFKHDANEENEELVNQRSVSWDLERSRDALSSEARFSLGSLSTLFAIKPLAETELWSEAPSSGVPPDVSAPPFADPEEKDADLSIATARQVADLAQEKIKDKIAKLDPYQMQDLVAGLLRAMGYVTAVASPGPDRGRDIIASPDGFGFKEPRIVVEVKHRTNRIGAPDIRAFIGGRRPHEKCLYVSTGGFARDAYYEAERAVVPLTLLDFEQLVEAVLLHYPKFDEATRQLIPLVSIYWPL